MLGCYIKVSSDANWLLLCDLARFICAHNFVHLTLLLLWLMCRLELCCCHNTAGAL